MKLDELKAMLRATWRPGSGPDRMTLLLVAAAIFLTAVAGAIVLDLLISPQRSQQAAQTASTRQAASAATAPKTTAVPITTPTAGTPPPCIAPHDWGVHIVQEGDTLYSLALRYGSDLETLKAVNCLEKARILIGQQLYVPGPLALPTFATPTPGDSGAPEIGGTPQPAEAAADATSGAAQGTGLQVTPLATPAGTPTPSTAFQVDIPNRYINIALLGTDQRPHQRPDGIDRTDSIIIVSINTEDSSVSMLHIPRDLWVYIPGYGYNRINTAYLWGEMDEVGTGPEWVKRTIHHNLGIPIHYYVQMQPLGFQKVVDTLGGVDIDVACALPELNLEPGMHHLEGEMAYEFVHTRETSNDYDRGRRQRKMLMALWEQALTPETITKLPQLWMTMSDTFTTDIPLDQALNLARLGLQIDFQDIETAAITNKQTRSWTTPEGWMVLLPREEEIRPLLDKLYNPVAEDEPADRKRVRAQVLNGTDRTAAEELAAAELKREGFKIVGQGENNPLRYSETQIIVRRGNSTAAERVAQALGVPSATLQVETTVPEPPNPSDPVDIRVILGRDYDPCQR